MDVDVEKTDKIKIFKVVLVGESGVGKTCIITRFIKNEFIYDEIPTIFASYSEKILELKNYDEQIRFHLWDTAGQEKYRSIANIFYKDSNAAILVYDITNRKSFEEIKDYWYDEVKKYTKENTNKFNFILIIFFYYYSSCISS